MNKWITDRLPTESDADEGWRIWITTKNGRVSLIPYEWVTTGVPWMAKQKVDRPEPYVEPKRWTVRFNGDSCWKWQTLWALYDWDLKCASLPGLSSREDHAEAAQRIADIYNEVMP